MGQQRRRQTGLATPSVAQPSCPSADLNSHVLRPTRRKGVDVVKRSAKNHLAVVFFISGKVQLRADGDQALKKELGVHIMRPW